MGLGLGLGKMNLTLRSETPYSVPLLVIKAASSSLTSLFCYSWISTILPVRGFNITVS